MHDEDDIGPILRAAYQDAPDSAKPSPFLWERTRRALRERDLLRARGASWRRVAAAVALAGAAFASGYGVGRGRPDHLPNPGVERAPIAEAALAAETVQGAGTNYARAVEGLVRALESASANEMATAREVLLAAITAGAEPTRILLGGGAVGDTTRSGADLGPVIWF